MAGGTRCDRYPLGTRPYDLSEEPLGSEDQDEDEDAEREDVLILCPEGASRQEREIGRRKGLQEPQDYAPEHGPRDVPDPPHRRGTSGSGSSPSLLCRSCLLAALPLMDPGRAAH